MIVVLNGSPNARLDLLMYANLVSFLIQIRPYIKILCFQTCESHFYVV